MKAGLEAIAAVPLNFGWRSRTKDASRATPSSMSSSATALNERRIPGQCAVENAKRDIGATITPALAAHPSTNDIVKSKGRWTVTKNPPSGLFQHTLGSSLEASSAKWRSI